MNCKLCMYAEKCGRRKLLEGAVGFKCNWFKKKESGMKWTVEFCGFENHTQEIAYESDDINFRNDGRKIIDEWERRLNDVAGHVYYKNENGRLCE